MQEQKPTAYEVAEANVFAYLDSLSREGKEIPGTRKIREACGVAQAHVCPAVRKWKEQRAQTQAQELARAGDLALSDAVSKAFDLVRQAVAQDVQAMREQMQKNEQERVKDFEQRENDLLMLVSHAEAKATDELLKSVRLAEQLRLETEARQRAEKARDEALNDRDRAEAESAEQKAQIKAQVQDIEELKAQITAKAQEIESLQEELAKLKQPNLIDVDALVAMHHGES